MPNLVNTLSLAEFTQDVQDMGSCIIVGFDKLTVAQASELRARLKEQEAVLKVVKNRLALRALAGCGHELPRLIGKCGVVFGPEERAIAAAKVVREFATQNRQITLEVLAGVVEGEVIAGDDAKSIADMPDKETVRAQIAMAISGPARALATVLSGVGGGLARCLQQRADGEDAKES